MCVYLCVDNLFACYLQWPKGTIYIDLKLFELGNALDVFGIHQQGNMGLPQQGLMGRTSEGSMGLPQQGVMGISQQGSMKVSQQYMLAMQQHVTSNNSWFNY